MANREHLEILKQGVEVWNRWREENPDVWPDLSKAKLAGMILKKADLSKMDFSDADLRKVNFAEANLNHTVLNRVYLSRANLIFADLSYTSLRRADLIGTNFFGANLSEADLVTADLSKANFSGADLTGAFLVRAHLNGVELRKANLENVTIGQTSLGGIDFSEVQGLHTIEHYGPSYVDMRTIYLSEGKIPEVFLRGSGVPDTLITYIASLTGKDIQYYSCFISYSSQDEAFAQRLHAALQQNGVRCWFAPEDMKIGDKIRPAIDQSIRIHDKLLIILSESSINSTWVEKEVETAFEEEAKRKQTVLFPVRLDEAVMETDQPWAADIRRTRHIGDFSRWKDHDAYQQAFERLLRDLKAA